MEEYNLVVKNDKGELALSDQVVSIIDTCEEECKKANDTYSHIKELLINAMLDNNIKTANVGKYKISVREYKDKYIFDAERFLKEENEEIVIAFSSIEKSSNTTFNIDKFKEEHPEMYAKYLETDTEENIVVDDTKLYKTLPKIWEKYVTKEDAKAPSITIKQVGD